MGNLLKGLLPIGVVDVSGVDPTGICEHCRHFITGVPEVEQEWEFLCRNEAGRMGITLHTSERLRDKDGYEVGDETAKTVTHYQDIKAAIAHRLHVNPDDAGLCEKGVARIVFKTCGKGADQSGERTDQCPIWQPLISRIERLFGRKRPILPRDWREKRAVALQLRAMPTFQVQADSPCPWHPGRPFKSCCGRGHV